MTGSSLLDAAGRRRSLATMSGFHRRPPTAQQGPAVPRRSTDCGGDRRGDAPRRRSTVRPQVAGADRAALARGATDQRSAQPRRERPGLGSWQRPGSPWEGGKRREVGMDQWAWQHLNAWLEIRIGLRVGALICVIDGPTQGRPWSPTAARTTLGQLAGISGASFNITRISNARISGSRRSTCRDRQQRDHRRCPPPPRADAPGSAGLH
jgi:hypothetical protein